MPRQKYNEEEYAVEQMQKVISAINEHRFKTWRDLWDVAYQFCAKNFSHAEETAKEWGVAPIYLVLTALLYIEHPLLVADGRRWLYTLAKAQQVIIQVEMRRTDLAVPILPTHSINSHVDGMRGEC